MFEPNTHRTTNCGWCGKRFVDDCGDSFCSSHCDYQYGQYHLECSECGCEQGDDIFPNGETCEDCLEKMEDDE